MYGSSYGQDPRNKQEALSYPELQQREANWARGGMTGVPVRMGPWEALGQGGSMEEIPPPLFPLSLPQVTCLCLPSSDPIRAQPGRGLGMKSLQGSI